MNESGKTCTEANTRTVQDTVRFSRYRITDDDPSGTDNYANGFAARTGRENGRKSRFRVLMNRNTRDRLDEACPGRISMSDRGHGGTRKEGGYQDNHVHDRSGSNRNGKHGTRRQHHKNGSNRNTEDMKKLKTGKERMFAMADAFTASVMPVLTGESPVRIGDENLYVPEDGEVSGHETTGAMAPAMTEVTDRTGPGNGRRPAKPGGLLHILTGTVTDMISGRCVETARIHGEQYRNARDIRQRQPETQLKTDTQ